MKLSFNFDRNYLSFDRIKCVIDLNHLIIDLNSVVENVIAIVFHTDCDIVNRCNKRHQIDNFQFDVNAIC